MTVFLCLIFEQECIPVGCVPTILYRTGQGCLFPSLSRRVQRQIPPGRNMGSGSQTGSDIIQRLPPLVDRMTDVSKNITLPLTSFAGGKNAKLSHNDNDSDI